MRLSDIIRHLRGIFEGKRRNPVQLDNDSNLESKLKPLKVSTKNTPIQISEDDVNIDGTLKVKNKDVPILVKNKFARSNELLTISENNSTKLESESNLIFDGNTLNITSIPAAVDSWGQIKLSYDTDDYAYISVDPQANMDIRTVRSGTGTNGSIELQAAGNIVLDADNNYVYIQGSVLYQVVFDLANSRFMLRNAADTGDQLAIQVGANGSTTFTTTDDDGEAGHLALDVDGDITLNSASGNFIAEKGGTQFSSTNSAYAGMILGYTCLSNLDTTAGNDSISIGTSMTVLQTDAGNDVKVTFVAPPSGNVEIVFSALVDALSRTINFALSDNATYNELAAIQTYDVKCVTIDESDEYVNNIRWYITGLTAGTSYTYFIAAKASSASAYIYHGVNRLNAHSPPIIVKAIALPTTNYTGE